MPRRPRTEAEKEREREAKRRRYHAERERFLERERAKRAADKAAGIKPKPRAPRSDAAKAGARERAKRDYWENPEPLRAAARERARQRREADRDSVNARKRTVYGANRERVLGQQREYLEKNREAIRARARARIDHVENRARVKQWRAGNPDKVRQAKKRRRAREAAVPIVDFTAEQWQALLEEFGGLCAYCPAPATTQDHLTPLSRGGWHTAANIVPACLRCNCRKGTRTLIEFLELGFLVHSWDGAA